MSEDENHSENQANKMIARVTQDWLCNNDEYMAIVIESSHSRYKEGEKPDWHRIWFALHDGYTVELKPVN